MFFTDTLCSTLAHMAMASFISPLASTSVHYSWCSLEFQFIFGLNLPIHYQQRIRYSFKWVRSTNWGILRIPCDKAYWDIHKHSYFCSCGPRKLRLNIPSLNNKNAIEGWNGWNKTIWIPRKTWFCEKYDPKCCSSGWQLSNHEFVLGYLRLSMIHEIVYWEICSKI